MPARGSTTPTTMTSRKLPGGARRGNVIKVAQQEKMDAGDVIEDDNDDEDYEDEPNQKNGDYACYVLQSLSNPRRTYVGITNNRQKRIQRHNGLLAGGAKATQRDRPWRMIHFVHGFTYHESLKFEWSLHHPRARRIPLPHWGREGRLNCVERLLARDPWKSNLGLTSVSLPPGSGDVFCLSTYCFPPEVQPPAQ